MLTLGIQRLLAPKLSPWATIVPMRLLGRNVGAVVTRLEDEHRRREEHGVGALDNSNLLRVLFQLPHRVSVPSSGLSSWERNVLARRPDGVAELRRGMITRLACPPLKVELVAVSARNWRSGLYWASQYGPFCQRVLALPSLPQEHNEIEELELEAKIFGVGVVSTHPAEGWLVAPTPFKPKRHSSGQWLFSERAYAELLMKQRPEGD